MVTLLVYSDEVDGSRGILSKAVNRFRNMSGPSSTSRGTSVVDSGTTIATTMSVSITRGGEVMHSSSLHWSFHWYCLALFCAVEFIPFVPSPINVTTE